MRCPFFNCDNCDCDCIPDNALVLSILVCSWSQSQSHSCFFKGYTTLLILILYSIYIFDY